MVLRPLLLFLGILNFFGFGELGPLESESVLFFSYSVAESESEELLKSGTKNFGFFRPDKNKNFISFIKELFQFF